VKTIRTLRSDVFLNIPYDQRFADLFLAYIAGLSAFGLHPHTALEVPGGERRLDRIFELMRRCRYSVHDLSRVEVARGIGPSPRFNMPFELGLAVAWHRIKPRNHTWYVFEAKPHRIEKTLSDLDGTDVYIHRGRPAGVFSELTNAFIRMRRQPNVDDMRLVYRDLRASLPDSLRHAGTRSPFQARVFRDMRLRAEGFAAYYVNPSGAGTSFESPAR
jgi:hypothetical protein